MKWNRQWYVSWTNLPDEGMLPGAKYREESRIQ